ncbi:MAG: universal stress protein [Pseudomonadota bacterium]
MPRVLTCIDGSIYSSSVARHAAWAAQRMSAEVELLQVIGRREAASQDRSGSLMAGARRALLEELAELDSQRAKLIQRQARLDLEEAEAALREGGIAEVRGLLRHGDLLDALAEREAEANLVVIGKRGAAAGFARQHLGSNLERILRAAQRPVLIAAREFQAPRRFVLAFDGQAKALEAVDVLSRSVLFAGLPGLLLHAGPPTEETRDRLDAAAAQLRAGGLEIEARIVEGPPAETLAHEMEDGAGDLLVMGAYGHSRLRTMMIGSTTSEMIRTQGVPVLVFR